MVPKYLIKGSYNETGIKGVLKEGGTSRQQAVEAVLGTIGGTLDACYFAFGDTDAYLIVDLPDNVKAAALAATVGASGRFSRYETVVLLTPADIDAATKIAVDYRPPGG
jgi:uncharacterized protein with GYD domain